MSTTWFDLLDPAAVQGALCHLDELPAQPEYLARANGDPRFSLWLRLVDEHLERLASGRHPVEDLRTLYESGTAPRSAAYIAIVSGLAPTDLEAVSQ